MSTYKLINILMGVNIGLAASTILASYQTNYTLGLWLVIASTGMLILTAFVYIFFKPIAQGWTDISFGLSSRKHLPCIKLFGSSYVPWKIFDLLGAAKRWNVRQIGPNLYRVTRFGYSLILPQKYLGLLIGEWNLWEKHYLPLFSLNDNRTVLDVGAGAGETMLLFFIHGAKKVIAIESDPKLAMLARQNAKANNWNAEVIEERFNLGHLTPDIDFMKMDIDGGESILLNADSLPVCRIEVHSSKLAKQLKKRFGLKIEARLIASGFRSIMG